MEICFRCQSELELRDDNPEGVDFYSCPKCNSEYAKKPDQQLQDRWMSPITIHVHRNTQSNLSK